MQPAELTEADDQKGIGEGENLPRRVATFYRLVSRTWSSSEIRRYFSEGGFEKGKRGQCGFQNVNASFDELPVFKPQARQSKVLCHARSTSDEGEASPCEDKKTTPAMRSFPSVKSAEWMPALSFAPCDPSEWTFPETPVDSVLLYSYGEADLPTGSCLYHTGIKAVVQLDAQDTSESRLDSDSLNCNVHTLSARPSAEIAAVALYDSPQCSFPLNGSGWTSEGISCTQLCKLPQVLHSVTLSAWSELILYKKDQLLLVGTTAQDGASVTLCKAATL